MTIIHSSSEYYEVHGTYNGYKEQWDSEKPELGKVYACDADIVFRKWKWTEFIIVFIDEKVALGKSIKPDYFGSREYRLFNVKDGFKYQDDRPFYRLQNLEKIKNMKELKEKEFERRNPQK